LFKEWEQGCHHHPIKRRSQEYKEGSKKRRKWESNSERKKVPETTYDPATSYHPQQVIPGGLSTDELDI